MPLAIFDAVHTESKHVSISQRDADFRAWYYNDAIDLLQEDIDAKIPDIWRPQAAADLFITALIAAETEMQIAILCAVIRSLAAFGGCGDILFDRISKNLQGE